MHMANFKYNIHQRKIDRSVHYSSGLQPRQPSKVSNHNGLVGNKECKILDIDGGVYNIHFLIFIFDTIKDILNLKQLCG